MLKFVGLFLFIQSALCVIFDLNDLYDPLSVLWHKGPSRVPSRCTSDGALGECIHPAKCIISGGTVGDQCGRGDKCCTFPEKYKECKSGSGTGSEQVGVCMKSIFCHKSGGVPKGNSCGLLEKCCIYDNSCETSTSAKVSYFEGNYITNADQPTTCSYTVYFQNPHVCQVRLDFEAFSLAEASIDAANNIQCVQDSLSIEPDNYGIPVMCGNNNNNHVYVHLAPGNEKVTLTMKLAKRTEDDALELPHWRIKITQLQCGGDKTDYENSASDFPLLAPLGYIQYFTEPSGVIKSFGYEKSYTTGQYYSIAIKKGVGYCGAQLTPSGVNFQSTYPQTDDSTCVDYLGVPGFSILNTTYTNTARSCMNDTNPFNSVTPGPVVLTFFSNTTRTLPDSTSLSSDTTSFPFFFKYAYKLLSSC
ncbi:unnamed protein product [Brassicogethes aeneus]|uniref:CUB domain-containing protein n=1 Tax=Brassicogethes aeneus TaxID=1431903 RepID=A0A9P0FG93_BRAAE|nr:unnamed protein product [Brassicogethes aeneus]